MFNPVQFAKEAYGELQKVTWLPRKQMVASTIVVIVLVAIVSLYVSVIDLVVAQVFGIFIRI